MLSRTYGPVVEQGIRIIRSNQEMRALYNYLDIVADIKKRRLECIDHVIIMYQERRVYVFESKP